MIKTLFLACVLTCVGGCTLTNSQGQSVVLTAASAPTLIIAQMKKGCADLMANQALVNFAVATATKALRDTSGVIADVGNAASVGCSLLVPPPATPVTAPTG